MRVGNAFARWVDARPWRFKLLLLAHCVVVGAILPGWRQPFL
jgi:hypothetical protein